MRLANRWAVKYTEEDYEGFWALGLLDGSNVVQLRPHSIHNGLGRFTERKK